ncbi:pyridoxal phosphate-dependent transferase [Scheffersomyces amazonensis]|uniref:pyridoxal phosphate-dependent transferase n=1 Tax=Scheffersomyces amazonensis TaxID=1078765 RepID=UPI00315DF4AC
MTKDSHLSSKDVLESSLLHRSLTAAPAIVTKTSGPYLYLSNGEKILDGCGGAAVISVGHSNPEVVKAVSDQLSQVSYIHTSDYTTSVSEKLANKLLEKYQDKLSKVYFVNSGSEANEAAVKLATQYFFEQGKTSKSHFISRNQSYHGNCLAGLSLSGFPARRVPYEQIISDIFHKVDPAYEYRYKHKAETTEEYVKRLADQLEQEILQIGPENVAGFFAETVVGATTGCVTAPKGYFKAIQKVCQKYDVLLILDEIMCGSGRTGTFFAWEQEGIVPDITTAGKALGSGYSPLAAVFITPKIIDVLKKGSSAFVNGHTYQCFSLSSAAGLAVQTIIERDGLLTNVLEMGTYLEIKLKEKLSQFDIVGDIRGRGLFWGVEFVKDKRTLEPLDPSLKSGPKIQSLILKRGVAVYPGFGTKDGYSGDHILIAPSFDVTKDQIDIIVDTIAQGITDYIDI